MSAAKRFRQAFDVNSHKTPLFIVSCYSSNHILYVFFLPNRCVAFAGFVGFSAVFSGLFGGLFAGFVCFAQCDNSDIRVVSSGFQLIENNVFHGVSFLDLPEIQSRISQS